MATYTTDPVATGLMSVSTAPAMVNGAAIGSGINFTMPAGPSVSDAASNAYGFLTANNMMAQGFLGQTIANGMNLFNYQISPLTQSLANATQSLANTGNAGAAYMTNAAAQVPSYTNANQFYTTQFANNIQYLEQSQGQQANNAIGVIQSISQGSFNTSATASQQGGGGSFIVTALVESDPKNAQNRIIHAKLVKWRDEWVRQARCRRRLLLIYYRVAPQIVAGIKAHPHGGEIFAYLKHSYLTPALAAFEDGRFEDAFRIYVLMSVDAAAIVGVDLSGYRLPDWATLETDEEHE